MTEMTEELAREILKGSDYWCIRCPNGHLAFARLDGEFDLEELEALAFLMRNKGGEDV